MDETKAGYFLQDLAAYRAGEIDEAAMTENLMYFLNTATDTLTISQEKFDELRAKYESFDAMLDYYEKVAKSIIEGEDPSSMTVDVPAV